MSTELSRCERRMMAVLRLLRQENGPRLIMDDEPHARLAGASGAAVMTVPREVAAVLVERDLVACSTPPWHAATKSGLAWLARHEQAALGFRAQHGLLREEQIEDEDGLWRKTWRDQAESPLTWLRARKGKDGKPFLDDEQFAAGEKLRSDIARAQMLARTTSNWQANVTSGRRGAGPDHFTDGTIAARERVQRALSAVGPDLSGLLVDICGYLKPMETVESERGWPARSGRIVLGIALTRLVAHYGLDRRPQGGRSGGIRAWRDQPAFQTAGEEP